MVVGLDDALHVHEEVALGVGEGVAQDGGVQGLVIPGAAVEVLYDVEGQSVDHVCTLTH